MKTNWFFYILILIIFLYRIFIIYFNYNPLEFKFYDFVIPIDFFVFFIYVFFEIILSENYKKKLIEFIKKLLNLFRSFYGKNKNKKPD